MYIKIGGIEPIKAVIGLATWLIGEVMFPWLLPYFLHCCSGASSFIA